MKDLNIVVFIYFKKSSVFGSFAENYNILWQKSINNKLNRYKIMKTTIEYKKVDLEIGYCIQPEERQTLEYPRCDAELVIEELFINGIDVMELLEMQIEEIEQELIEYLKP